LWWLFQVLVPRFPVTGPAAHVHDSEDMQFVTPDAEYQGVGKDFKTTFADASFETTMNFRTGDDAIFGIFPFFQKAGLEVALLFTIPRCGCNPSSRAAASYLTCMA
jgi:hypothetical protein